MRNISKVISGLLSLGAACGLVQAQSTSVVPSRITAPIRDEVVVPLQGNVHPLARPEFDAGAVNGSVRADRMMLLLRRSSQQEADLGGLLRALQTPASPSYHAYLTPEEFGKRFGPTDADLAQVQTWLKSHGFTVEGANRARTAVKFSGTVAQVEEAFHTSIHRFNVAGAQHMANITDPQIPVALSPVVAGVSSLNDFKPLPQHVKGPREQWSGRSGRFTPQLTVPSGGRQYLFVGPGDAATIYNSPNSMNTKFTAGQTAYDGTGVIIGVAGTSGLSHDGFVWYQMLFGLPGSTNNANIWDGDPNNIDPQADDTEAVLDREIAVGVAPGAGIWYYAAGDTAFQSGLFLAIYRALDDNKVDILNVSYGACEADLGAAGNQLVLNAWEQAAAQGIAVTVSSGDSGSAGCDNPNLVTAASHGFGVNGLASTPYNIAVGGTDFDVLANNFSTYVGANTPTYTSALGYIPEQPWNDSTSTNGALASNSAHLDSKGNTNIWAGGGGPSTTAVGGVAGYPKPTWQAAFAPSNADTVRDVPDVSLLAGAGGYQAMWAICLDSDCNGSTNFTIHGVGGTSTAAPALAGILAMVQQKVGSRLGQASPVLYQLAASTPSVFHAVTKGNISVVCKAGSPNCGSNGFLTGYNAGSAYNLATGLGSVDASALVAHWGDASRSATTVTLSLDKTSFTHGTAVALNAAVSPASATGLVAIESQSPNGSGAGAGSDYLTLSGGVAKDSFSQFPGGTYNVLARYAGDDSHAGSVSQPVQVTVQPEDSQVQLSTYRVDSNYNLVDLSNTTVPFGTLISFNARPIGASQAGSQNPVSNATGGIYFTDPGSSYGASTISLDSSGLAEWNTTSLQAGVHSVTAQYFGDRSYNASTAGPITFTIAKAPTTISVSSAVTSTIGSAITVNAQIQANLTVSFPLPTGTVTFTNLTTGKVVGTGYPAYQCSGATKVCMTSFVDVPSAQLAAGANSIVAEYGGDGNYLDSGASAAFTLTCSAGCYNASGYSLSFSFYQMNPANGTVTAGGSLTTSVSVNPGGGFTGAVNLTCSVTGQSSADVNIPTCTFNPQQVKVTDPKLAVDSVLTVNTTVAKGAAVRAHYASRSGPMSSGIALAAIVLCVLPVRRVRKRYLLLIAMLAVIGGFSACGGSGSGGSGGGTGGGGGGTGGTTADLYTVTFKAVDAATGTVTAQDYFNMRVQ